MRRLLFVVLVAGALLAGCEKKESLYTYHDEDSGLRMVWTTEELCAVLERQQDELQGLSRHIDKALGELQTYTSCPEHRFEFQCKSGEYYIFQCSRCKLKQKRSWPDLTEVQREALRTLNGKVEQSHDFSLELTPEDVRISALETIVDIDLPSNITISCGNGKQLVIDYGGGEVKVAGASEEGAKIFFEQMLKPIIDEYLRSKKQ